MNLFICPICETEQHTAEAEPLYLSFFEDHDCEWIAAVKVNPAQHGPSRPDLFDELLEEMSDERLD